MCWEGSAGHESAALVGFGGRRAGGGLSETPNKTN